jgi:uncharacterized protein YecT (DUF1311 family)
MPSTVLFSAIDRLAKASRFFIFIVSLFLPPLFASAQACHFAGEQNADATSRTLEQAPSCRSANDYLTRCAWGSSADVGFAEIVIKKCEAHFLAKLPADALARYKQEQLLCGAYISPDSGTLALSEAATCSAAVSTDFATDPTASNRKPLKASFDCSRAYSPVEIATCSSQQLGNADIAMARAYRAVMRNTKSSNKPALIQEQKAWQAKVISVCGLPQMMPASTATLACIADAYAKRTYHFNDCLDAADGCPADANQL